MRSKGRQSGKGPGVKGREQNPRDRGTESQKVKPIKVWLSGFLASPSLRFILCVLCLSYILGCSGAEVVRIKVGVESKVDMQKYKTIAVIDFIEDDGDSHSDQGGLLARMIRRQLKNSKEFHVLDERTTHLVLDTGIDKSKLENPEALVSICNQLGVGALIVGTYDFHQINQPVPYVVERYSPRTGRYNPETRTYIRRLYRFSFHAKVVDGKTGETVFDYAPRAAERPEFRSTWGLPLSEEGADPTSLRNMATRPVTAFAMSLIPHYEYEKRVLAR